MEPLQHMEYPALLKENCGKPYFGYHTKRYDDNQLATLSAKGCVKTSFFHNQPERYYRQDDYQRQLQRATMYYKAFLANGVCCNQIIPHAPYVLNLASPDKKYQNEAMFRLTHELRMTRLCGLKYLNIHCGTTRNQADESVFKQVASIINTCLSTVPDVCILLETVVQNSSRVHAVGSNFRELHAVMSHLSAPNKNRVFVTIDTQHCFAGGYTTNCDKYIEELFTAFQTYFTMDQLKCIHLNNSLVDYNSSIDRHANIHAGKIEVEQLRRLLSMQLNVTYVLEVDECEGELEWCMQQFQSH